MKKNFKNLLKELLREGKIREEKTDADHLNGLLYAAEQNFLSAEYNFRGGFYETAFKSAYDGLLQISRVILLLNGYRPDNGEQHKTTFMVAGLILGEKFESLMGKVDRYRIKRNRAIYQPIDFISEIEARNIINAAREYWFCVQKYLQSKNPQLKLFKF